MTDELRLAERNVDGGRPGVCLNCAAALSGPFCSECGQRDIPPYPSTKELVVDAVSEFSGWDGRFAATLRTLIGAPGKLTLEFLEGRRVRYISPLRLYLTASVVYFLIAASVPTVRVGSANVEVGGLRIGTNVGDKPKSRPERVGEAADKAMNGGDLTAAEKAAALADASRAPAFMRPFLRRAIADPVGFKRGIFENMPRLLFVLLPAFAAVIALFYRRRKYPEHLYFALHLYTFFFLAISLTELSKFTQLAVLVEIVSFLMMIAIPTYATMAFRRVYGGTVMRTIAKELGIAAIYGVFAIVAFVVMIYLVSVSGA